MNTAWTITIINIGLYLLIFLLSFAAYKKDRKNKMAMTLPIATIIVFIMNLVIILKT